MVEQTPTLLDSALASADPDVKLLGSGNYSAEDTPELVNITLKFAESGEVRKLHEHVC